MMPRAGGPYVFLREAYGPSIGISFRLGAVSRHSNWDDRGGRGRVCEISRRSRAGDRYRKLSHRADLVGRGYAISLSTEQLVAIALIFSLTWTNTRGLELGRLVQNTFTFAKTAALIALIVIGLSLGWKCGLRGALRSTWWDSWPMAGVRRSRSLV